MHQTFLCTRRWPRAAASLLTLALASGGCAPLPALDPPALARPAADYRSATALSAPSGVWPTERWWENYRDPQLDALIDEALRDAPDMAAAAARLRNAEAASRVAASALQPQLGARATTTLDRLSYNHLVPRSPETEGWNDYGRVTVDLGWELDFWGKNRAGLAAASSQLEAVRAELAATRIGLVAAIASDYAELARLFAVRDSVVRSVAVRSRTVELFEQRFNHGLETRGGVSEARARLAAAEGDLLQVDEQISLQRIRLAALAGAGPDRGLDLVRPLIRLDAAYALPAELAASLLGRRPDITAARLMVEARLHRVEQKKAAFYPDVNLSAFIGVQALGLDLLGREGSTTGSIGPAISLPLFTGGRLQAELRGSAAAHDEAVASYNRSVAHALQEVASAGASLKSLSARLDRGRAAVAAATDAHRVANERYQGGLATHLDVLFAEDILLSSQRQLADLQSRAFALDVALKRALGGGYQAQTL